MTTPESFPEEECFNVFWKIKNFSYCCEKITSPEFCFLGNPYCIQLDMESIYVYCTLKSVRTFYGRGIDFTMEISFLTCDGLPEESFSGGHYLKVPKDAIFGSRRNSFLPEDTLTVRFRSLTKCERVKHFICSEIVVKRKYFLWTFKNVSNYQYEPKSYNEYDMRRSVEESECYGNIVLILKPTGGINIAENFSIEISRTGGEWCYCILKVSVLDADGKALNCVSDEFVFEKSRVQRTRVFPSLIKKSKLLACTTLLLPNDTLSLKCDFAISLGKVTDGNGVISYCEDVAHLRNESDDLSMSFNGKNDSGCVTDLQTHLKSMMDDGTLHDVSLQIGSEVIRAHKNILSARSSVFRAMFTKDMTEAINNTVVIEDLDVETVRGLLLYMYTDTINDEQWESMKKLYFASDKYEVLSLKDKCVSSLKTNLSISNVCEVLDLADLHQDANLKTAALDFISEYNSEVFASEAWKELEKNNSSLAFQIMRELYSNKRVKLN